MKIAIIGGTGYIGSKLYQYLEKSHEIDTIDTEWFGNFVNPNNIKKDYQELSAEFWEKYDVIILLAGHSSVPMCLNSTMLESFNSNVVKFVELISKISRKLIYASSSSVYGNTGNIPAPETWDKFSPSNYYDLTKKIIDLYAEINDGKFYGLRMGTLAGSSPNLRTDIMINKMFDTAKRTHKIEIYNPEIYRPILGIQDLCRAVQLLIENDVKPGVYNLASFNANVQQISQAVADNLGNIEIINNGNSGFVYNFSIDTQKFQKTFNFVFEETVESIVNSLTESYETCNKGIRI